MLLNYADSADAGPTQVAQQTFTMLESTLTDLEANWSSVKEKDIPALNDKLRAANLPAITAKTSE